MTRWVAPTRRQALIAAGSPLAIAAALAVAASRSDAAGPSTVDTSASAVVSPSLSLPPSSATPVVIPLGRAVPVRKRPARLPPATGKGARLPVRLTVSSEQIPRPVLAAYVNAARMTDRSLPGCDLSWQVLAGIGYIESDNARLGGSGTPGWDGEASPHILGPVLDGMHHTAAIPDTDGGRLDGNTVWDRAVGPMQFLPSTWAVYGADGNHDGVKDPEQIDDATLAAGHYLCAAATDLARPRQLVRAVLSYNHSITYARDVLTVAAHYKNIDPKALGIGLLHHRHGHHRHARRDRKHTRRGATPRPTGAARTLPTPSPSPTTTGTPVPTPTTSTPGVSPAPTPSSPVSPAPSGSPTPTPSPVDSGSPSPDPSVIPSS